MGRVLIVDNEKDAVEIFAMAVKVLGHQPRGVHGGQEAVGLIPLWKPDLVLLDYHMPDPDGLKTLDEIRALPGGEEIPVVIVTASSEEGLADRTADRGGDGCIFKPLDMTSLTVLIEQHMVKTPIFA